VKLKKDINDLYIKKGDLCDSCDSFEDGKRCLTCDQLCELCVDVCPNRANVSITVESDLFSESHQIVHIDGMCNECGNCGVFCPHTGNPYKDKITVFWTLEDFEDSTNKGFLMISNTEFKVRTEDKKIVHYTLGEDSISPHMKLMIDTVISKYNYYLNN